MCGVVMRVWEAGNTISVSILLTRQTPTRKMHLRWSGLTRSYLTGGHTDFWTDHLVS